MFTTLRGLLGRSSPTSWVTIQTVYTQLFGVVVFGLQAPLLGPRAFGLLAIVMVFISLCDSWLETSIDVLICVREIEPMHYATMNGITALAGSGLGLTLVFAAEPLAAQFGEPELATVIRVMAILPLVTALGATPNAATKRQMEFKPLAIRMIWGVTCGGIVGVLLTLTGAGVWALVGQTIVQRVIGVVVLWRNSPIALKLGLSRRHWRDLACFTRPLLLSRTMSWMASQLPRYVLALNLTVTELGLYSLAARLSDILVQVTVVPSSAVARVQLRNYATDPTGLDAAVTKFVARMSTLCFPLCFIGATLTPTLMHAWLNPRWFAAIIPAQVLLLSAFTWVTFYGGGILFLALNQQRSEALMSVLQTATILGAVVGFGARGLTAVSIAMAIRPLLLLPIEATLVRVRCRVSLRALLASQCPALCCAAASGIAVLLLRDWIEELWGSRLALLALATAGLVLYSVLLMILNPRVTRQIWQRVSVGIQRALAHH